MTVEVETKLKVESLVPAREALEHRRGVFVVAARQRDLFYDMPDGWFRAADSVVRIRRWDVQRGRPMPSKLTYKGSRQPGRMKRRREIEVTVQDPEAAGRLLESLGFTCVSVIEKRRERWELGPCRVELDEVPYLGTFVEIEGPGEAAIAEVQRELGLASLPHVDAGYVSMLIKYCEARNLPVGYITF
jgi:adenylate cyclase class 2